MYKQGTTQRQLFCRAASTVDGLKFFKLHFEQSQKMHAQSNSPFAEQYIWADLMLCNDYESSRWQMWR